jgi:hypothetical protein
LHFSSSFTDAREFERPHPSALRLHVLILYLGMRGWLPTFLASSFPLEAFPATTSSFPIFRGCLARVPPAYQSIVGLEDA